MARVALLLLLWASVATCASTSRASQRAARRTLRASRSPHHVFPGGRELDARVDFGCKGDGAADDWGCLQAGIDAAIRQGRRFRVPAGQYLVSQPLRIAGANATNATTGATEALTSLAMEGDGLAQTKIVASTKMFAVIMYPTCCGDLAPTTTHQYIGKMVIDSNGTADYGIQGSAITGSLFEELYVVNSQVAGISLGFGYNNRIVNSELESNYMGVVVMNADNNVQVERCVIVDCIVGIYIGGGLGVKVTGCDIEGNGGPAIIAFGTRALTIDSNYFEANNKVASWAATGPPGWVGKPFTMVPEGPLSGDPTGELTGDLTVQSDVVLNGGPSWNEGNTWLGQPGNGSIYNVSRFPRWTYGIAYPVTAAQLINNFHNEPVGAAYLIIACAHCRFDGNAIGAHYGSHEQDKDPITRECGHDPRALIAVSTDRRISLARHISARNNDGFCWRTTDKSGSKGIGLALSNAGLLEVLPPLLPAANMSIAVPTSRPTVSPDWNTFDFQGGPSLWSFNAEPASPSLLCIDAFRDSPGSFACGLWPDASASPPRVRKLDWKQWWNGVPTWEISCAVECILPLGRPQLSLSPTIAGQAVYIAVQLRVLSANSHTYNGMAVPLMLEIFDGNDWHASANNTYTPATGSAEAVYNGDWRVHMFMAVIGWNATHDEALFQLRMGGGQRVNYTENATIQVAKVVVAPVGHASP